MGYLEAPLSLNPAEREPKTTIVTRVMLAARCPLRFALCALFEPCFIVPNVLNCLNLWNVLNGLSRSCAL